jgi:hypothetical protein
MPSQKGTRGFWPEWAAAASSWEVPSATWPLATSAAPMAIRPSRLISSVASAARSRASASAAWPSVSSASTRARWPLAPCGYAATALVSTATASGERPSASRASPSSTCASATSEGEATPTICTSRASAALRRSAGLPGCRRAWPTIAPACCGFAASVFAYAARASPCLPPSSSARPSRYCASTREASPATAVCSCLMARSGLRSRQRRRPMIS